MKNESYEQADPQTLAVTTRAAVEKLSEQAEHLKKLSQLQSLKEKPVELSVDTGAILEGARMNQQKNDCPADLREMLDVLRLFIIH